MREQTIRPSSQVPYVTDLPDVAGRRYMHFLRTAHHTLTLESGRRRRRALLLQTVMASLGTYSTCPGGVWGAAPLH
jgi:hypothetical protein